ncbi:MAG: hypothetical protein GYB66_05670 [Chloroflexi bacterium]|nr:hypothetical protein [Chloroflexota bacterium]
MDILGSCVGHTLPGTLWQQGDQQSILVVGASKRVLKAKVLISGMVVLRYAIPYLGPAQHAVVPAVFVSERGLILKYWQVWRFITRNYQLYPRAEVLGLRSDGEEVQVFMRELDFGAIPRVLAYERVEDRIPLAEVNQLIVEDPQAAPELLVGLFPA